jgi:transcriptional regulator with XRE-family HTH domain
MNLERLRLRRGWSKTAFADALGISPQQLGNLQTQDNVETKTVERWADRLGIDVSEFFTPVRGSVARFVRPQEPVTLPSPNDSEPFTQDDALLVGQLVKLFLVASVQSPRDNAAAILLELAYALAVSADSSPEGIALTRQSIADARDQRARLQIRPSEGEA